MVIDMKTNLSLNVWKLGNWLLIACILWSPIAGIFDLMAFFRGITTSQTLAGDAAAATRIIRDLLIALFYVYFVVYFILRGQVKLKVNGSSLVVVAIGLLSAATIIASVLYTITNIDVPISVIIIGLKAFLYVPLFVAGGLFLQQYPFSLEGIRKAIIFVLVAELLIGLAEIIFMPKLFGVTVLGVGVIPTGTFAHYTIYASFLCIFIFGHCFVNNFHLPRAILVSTLIMTFISNSRTGLGIMAFLILVWLIKDYFQKVTLRGATVALLPFLVILGLWLLPSLVGGESRRLAAEEGIAANPRWQIWENYYSRDLTFAEMALGSGVGLASNAVSVVFGIDSFPGQFIPDSLHLAMAAQYGVLGLFFFYLFMATLLLEFYGTITLIVLGMILFTGFFYNVMEVYPTNLLLPVILALHSRFGRGKKW